MGVKYEGGEIFEAVMKGLMDVPDVTWEMVFETAKPLIKGLLEFGWDNAESTLGIYDEDPAIVAAFKENGVLLSCGSENPDDGEPCDGLERGHGGSHRDCLGRTWADPFEDEKKEG